MAQLWIEEADKAVWHLITYRERARSFRAACGWTLDPVRGRIWPQKPGEDGPAQEARCYTCVGYE